MTRPVETPNASDNFAFTSAGRDPALAFDEYRRLYSNGSDVERGNGAFRADVNAWRMGNMLLFERRLSGVVHMRTGRVESDGFDHFVLYALLGGELLGSAESRFDHASAGDIVLLDTTMPMRAEAPDTHYLTVSIARHLIEAIAGDPGRLHGTVLRPPATLILVDFLASLVHRVGDVDTSAMPNLSRVMIDLLGIALAGRTRAGSEARHQNFLRRQSVEAHISAHLSDRALSAAAISEATGISRSALYRLYEGQGGIARLIQTRRLGALRAEIEAGSIVGLTALAQRFGFSSEAHMSRLFSEENGCAPGAYRREVQSSAEGGVLTARRRWRSWMSELT